jgi:hypothetical protein
MPSDWDVDSFTLSRFGWLGRLSFILQVRDTGLSATHL